MTAAAPKRKPSRGAYGPLSHQNPAQVPRVTEAGSQRSNFVIRLPLKSSDKCRDCEESSLISLVAAFVGGGAHQGIDRLPMHRHGRPDAGCESC
jgi:hypothetical protein